ncbi:leucine-rich repeat-containing protein, partial [Tanacetum coccineum]
LVGHIDVQTFRRLTNLTALGLLYNNFSGEWDLDTSLSSLTNLEYLGLSYSGFSVTTKNANHYVNPAFRELDLASCKLKVFPNSFRAMKQLRWLDLSSNEIHGQIPHWAGEIGGNELYRLDLSHNFITGLPQFQGNGLKALYLQSNLIQGPFPPSICNISSLAYLDMSNNRIIEVIPKNISSPLQALNVKSNKIVGSFPPSICNMSLLASLDISDNSVGGVIPECVGSMNTLSMINLGANNFHGTIPNVFNASVFLEGLILNGNQLEGEVPYSLSKCQHLRVLDLGNNKLIGTFPIWLGGLSLLEVLVLRSNNFHGPIETSTPIELAFSSLQVLDLSHNWFAGKLPGVVFQNLKAMQNMVSDSTHPKYLWVGDNGYSITVVVKDVQLTFTKLLVDYTIIDLSNNRFEGGIPNTFGSLISLKVLNLSHNNLNGEIPNALGNISGIESLDLSWNQLIGEIPQSLAEINGLEVLNLSENQLVGRIPTGTQGGQWIYMESGDVGIWMWNISWIGDGVVLDLDETLVCAYETSSMPDSVRKQATDAGLTWFELECVSSYRESDRKPKISHVTVFERPGLHGFLAQLSKFADLVLFTAGLEGYARPLVDRIDAENRFSRRLYRPSTISTEYWEHVKDLFFVSTDFCRMVIVDNNPFSFLLQPVNRIPCIPFSAGQPRDDRGGQIYMSRIQEEIRSEITPNIVIVPSTLQIC